MILLIDNYDSFVYNLARYFLQLGFQSTVVRNDAITLNEIKKLAPSHIVLSPGPCTPDEAGICLELIDYFAGKIPMFGVCLGHQSIAQAFGGTIVRAEKPMHGKSSLIRHDATGLFREITSPLEVGRYHSLIVNREVIPQELAITAVSEENEIMALQHKRYPIYGVQFHPESILTKEGYKIVQNFIEICSYDHKSK